MAPDFDIGYPENLQALLKLPVNVEIIMLGDLKKSWWK